MLLVVFGHAWVTEQNDPNHKLVSLVISTIHHFHMQLFFAISGYLFWISRIEKPWTFSMMLRDKATRLLVPYMAFTLATFSLKPLASQFVKRPIEFEWNELISAIFIPSSNPLRELWFVAALFWMFFTMPILRYLFRIRNGVWLAPICAALISIVFPPWISALGVSVAFNNLPYFLLGAAFAGGVNTRILPWYWAVASGVAVLLSEYVIYIGHPLPRLVMATPWIALLFSITPIIARRIDGLFSSFRDWTFQIFLLGIFFQIPWRIAHQRLDFNYYISMFLSIVSALYIPVVISKAYKRFIPTGFHKILGL